MDLKCYHLAMQMKVKYLWPIKETVGSTRHYQVVKTMTGNIVRPGRLKSPASKAAGKKNVLLTD